MHLSLDCILKTSGFHLFALADFFISMKLIFLWQALFFFSTPYFFLNAIGFHGPKGPAGVPKTVARRAPCPVGTFYLVLSCAAGASWPEGPCREPKTMARRATFILFFHAPQALHGPKGLAGEPERIRKSQYPRYFFLFNALRKNRALRKK